MLRKAEPAFTGRHSTASGTALRSQHCRPEGHPEHNMLLRLGLFSAGFAGGGGRDGDILQISRSPSFTFFTKTRFSIREVPCCSLNPSSCPLLTGWLASTNSFPTMAFSCSAWEYQARTWSKPAILEEESLVIALLPAMLRATRCRRGNRSFFSFLS